MREINTAILDLLILILKNIEHYKALSKGILDKQNNFFTSINLPQPYPFITGKGINLINSMLANEWQSFESEVGLQNALVDEFNGYYRALSTEAHKMLLAGKTLNTQVINRDNDAIKQGAQEMLEATELFKERCFECLADLELSINKWKELDFTSVNLSEVKSYMKSLREFKTTNNPRQKILVKLRDQYKPENAFNASFVALSVED